jgi:hypothetical protein
VTPGSLVVSLASIAKVELRTYVPRGTRSNVGFALARRMPTTRAADE